MRTLSLFMGFLCVLVFLVPMNAQDFGFGFAEEDAESASAPASSSAAPTPSVNISGEVSAKLLGYVNDFSSFSEMKNTTLGDVFAGKLNVSASAFNAEGVINLKLAPVFNGSASPVKIDEAYLRAYFGDFSIEGGLRKLTWGKADSFGPLDVVNPMDYTDLIEITNLLGRKIARPLVHASYRLGAFSKLEGVLVPWFEGHRFADSGRWTPWQLRDLPDLMKADVAAYVINTAPAGLPSTVISDVLNTIRNYPVQLTYPSTLTLEYAQAGLRFTTTVASSDLGVQYYFGRLPRPAVMLRGLDTFWQHFDPETKEFTGSITPHSDYNGYHQIGLDYAQVIGGFNLRTELAAIITGDLSGDDGSVYNPSIAWSLGFDRDVIWGITLNLQAAESIRLLHDKIGSNIALDAEAGTDMTSTRITLILSKKFLQDVLEVKATGIWGIEDQDFFILPAIIWTKGDVAVELSGGFLGGNEKGELGQFHNNNFIKISLTYSF